MTDPDLKADRAEVVGRFALACGAGVGAAAEGYRILYDGPDGGFLPPPILTFFFFFVPGLLLGLFPGFLVARVRPRPDWIPVLAGGVIGTLAGSWWMFR